MVDNPAKCSTEPTASSSAHQKSLFLGWDVGAWYCGSSASRDALIVLEERADGLAIAGKPWKSNDNTKKLMPHLSRFGAELVEGMLMECAVPNATLDLVVAIDTPLGWPQAMLELATTGQTRDVGDFAENPYLFRHTERWFSRQVPNQMNLVRLKKANHTRFQACSAVQDQIGSHSTKGIHFVNRADLVRRTTGVWQSRDGSPRRVTAIETYPAPCEGSMTVNAEFERLAGSSFDAEIQSALRCAIVAWLFARHSAKLHKPLSDTPPSEGWMFLPTDI